MAINRKKKVFKVCDFNLEQIIPAIERAEIFVLKTVLNQTDKGEILEIIQLF